MKTKTTTPTKKIIPLHVRLKTVIEKLSLSKTKIAYDLDISRPTFNKYLKDGKICDNGRKKPHDLSPVQKQIIRLKYLQR